jgi:hypothetical protein
MSPPIHYAEAMRRKQRALGALVLAVVLVLIVIYRHKLGVFDFILGWATIIGGMIAGNRILACPACGRPHGSVFEKICSRCGAVLTDDPVKRPSTAGPVDARALAYMEGSRRILRRWAPIRRVLGKAVFWIGALSGLGVFLAIWLHGNDKGEAVVLGLFLWPVMTAAAWLILIFGVDNLFGAGFMLLRGRCPVCKAWFNPPSTLGPGSIHTDYSLPTFCASCGAKLG